MTEQKTKRIGSLIQAYVGARWGTSPDPDAQARLGAQLEPDVRERIDILGIDGERLLKVEAGEVWAVLERLEQEAAREDARIAAGLRNRAMRTPAEKGPTKARPPGRSSGRSRKNGGGRRPRGQR